MEAPISTTSGSWRMAEAIWRLCWKRFNNYRFSKRHRVNRVSKSIIFILGTHHRFPFVIVIVWHCRNNTRIRHVCSRPSIKHAYRRFDPIDSEGDGQTKLISVLVRRIEQQKRSEKRMNLLFQPRVTFNSDSPSHCALTQLARWKIKWLFNRPTLICYQSLINNNAGFYTASVFSRAGTGGSWGSPKVVHEKRIRYLYVKW